MTLVKEKASPTPQGIRLESDRRAAQAPERRLRGPGNGRKIAP